MRMYDLRTWEKVLEFEGEFGSEEKFDSHVHCTNRRTGSWTRKRDAHMHVRVKFADVKDVGV